jgi:hypothetical protein
MTSESRESTPEIPSEIQENTYFKPPQAYNSIQKLLEEVRERLNREVSKKEIDKDRQIEGEKIQDKKLNQIEFYQKNSIAEFIMNGLGAYPPDSRRNLPPLKHPENDNLKNINMFREDVRNNRNPILDFLSKCLPQQTQKPSSHPTQPSIERRRPAQFVR